MGSVIREMNGVYLGGDFANSTAISAAKLIAGGASGFDVAGANTKNPLVAVVGASANAKVPRGTTGSGNELVPIALGNVIVKADSTLCSGTFASFVGGVTVKPAASGLYAIASGSSNAIGTVLINDGTYAYIVVKTGIYNTVTVS